MPQPRIKVRFIKTIATKYRAYRKGESYVLPRADALYWIREGKAEKVEEQNKVVIQEVKTTKRPIKR